MVSADDLDTVMRDGIGLRFAFIGMTFAYNRCRVCQLYRVTRQLHQDREEVRYQVSVHTISRILLFYRSYGDNATQC